MVGWSRHVWLFLRKLKYLKSKKPYSEKATQKHNRSHNAMIGHIRSLIAMKRPSSVAHGQSVKSEESITIGMNCLEHFDCFTYNIYNQPIRERQERPFYCILRIFSIVKKKSSQTISNIHGKVAKNTC